MWEHSWAAGAVVSVVLWVMGAVAVTIDLFVGQADDIGHVGLLLALAGKLLFDRGRSHELREREQRAFDLGREAGSVTPFR